MEDKIVTVADLVGAIIVEMERFTPEEFGGKASNHYMGQRHERASGRLNCHGWRAARMPTMPERTRRLDSLQSSFPVLGTKADPSADHREGPHRSAASFGYSGCGGASAKGSCYPAAPCAVLSVHAHSSSHRLCRTR
jgi:hypothetical protein